MGMEVKHNTLAKGDGTMLKENEAKIGMWVRTIADCGNAAGGHEHIIVAVYPGGIVSVSDEARAYCVGQPISNLERVAVEVECVECGKRRKLTEAVRKMMGPASRAMDYCSKCRKITDHVRN